MTTGKTKLHKAIDEYVRTKDFKVKEMDEKYFKEEQSFAASMNSNDTWNRPDFELIARKGPIEIRYTMMHIHPEDQDLYNQLESVRVCVGGDNEGLREAISINANTDIYSTAFPPIILFDTEHVLVWKYRMLKEPLIEYATKARKCKKFDLELLIGAIEDVVQTIEEIDEQQ